MSIIRVKIFCDKRQTFLSYTLVLRLQMSTFFSSVLQFGQVCEIVSHEMYAREHVVSSFILSCAV